MIIRYDMYDVAPGSRDMGSPVSGEIVDREDTDVWDQLKERFEAGVLLGLKHMILHIIVE